MSRIGVTMSRLAISLINAARLAVVLMILFNPVGPALAEALHGPTLSDPEVSDLLLSRSASEFSSGMDKMVGEIGTSIESVLGAVGELPLVGDQLSEGVDPLLDTLDELNAEAEKGFAFMYEECVEKANPVECFDRGLYETFGPSGLDLLKDGPDDGNDVSIADISRDSGYDAGSPDSTRWVQWDVNLGQKTWVVLPFEFGLDFEDLDASVFENFGFNVDASNGIKVLLYWDLHLGFGVSARPDNYGGFFLNSGATDRVSGNSVPELQGAVEVTSVPTEGGEPGISADVNLGVINGRVEDGTTPRVQIEALEPVATAEVLAGSQVDYTRSFTLTIEDEGGVRPPITIDYQGYGKETFAEFLLNLNKELVSKTMGDYDPGLPAVLATANPKVRGIFDRRGLGGPHLLFTATSPEITAMTVAFDTSGDCVEEPASDEDHCSWGFNPRQHNDTCSRSLGFSSGQTGSGGVLTADAEGPVDGRLAVDTDFLLILDGTNVPVELRYRFHRDIEALAADDIDPGYPGDKPSLEERLDAYLNGSGDSPGALTQKGIDYEVEVSVTGDDRIKLDCGGHCSELKASWDPLEKSKLSVSFYADFVDPSYVIDNYDEDDQSTYNRLTYTEMKNPSGKLAFEGALAASAEFRLHIEQNQETISHFAEQGLGMAEGTLGLPEVAFDLNVDASAKVIRDEEYPEGDTEKSIDMVQFDNITLELGSLIETVVKPVGSVFGEAIGPVSKLLGAGAGAASSFLSEPIPVLDKVGPPMGWGQPSILELGLGPGGGAQFGEFLEGVEAMGEAGGAMADFLKSYSGEPICFGCLEYDETVHEIVPCQLATLISGIEASEFLGMPAWTAAAGGFRLDILSTSSMMDMILGNPFDIASYNLPAFEFAVDGSFGFDFDVLAFDVHVDAAVHLFQLGVVYDSTGLEKIVSAAGSGAMPDFTDLTDGFYLRNDPSGEDVWLALDCGGGGEVDLKDCSAVGCYGVAGGAEVGLGGTAYFEVKDPNNDGELRLDEIMELTDGFEDPLKAHCLFDTGVEIEGEFDFWGEVCVVKCGNISSSDIGVDSFSVGLSLDDLIGGIAPCTYDETPKLATPINEDGERVLRVNTGPFASQRIHGDSDDADATDGLDVTVEPDGGGLRVSIQDTASSDTALAGGLTQTYAGGFDRVTVIGSGYGDRIDVSGVSIPATLKGGGGDDILQSGSGSDTISGGDGNDTVTSGGGDDVLDGDAGDDTLNGGAGNDVLRGGSGNDTLDGEAGDDTLAGDTGDDELRGGAGSDNLDGGLGNDTLHGDQDNVSEEEPKPLDGSSGDDVLSGGSGDDTLDGGDGSDVLNGDRGADRLYGGPGDDVLDGGSGDDELYGGDGHDVLHGRFGADILDGGRDDDELFGGSGGDELRGGHGDDTLHGGSGEDVLSGDAGADALYGGLNDDLLRAGLADPWIRGDEGVDHLIFDDQAEEALSASLKPGDTKGSGTISASREGGAVGVTSYETVEEIRAELSGDRLTIEDAVLPLTVTACVSNTTSTVLVRAIHVTTTITSAGGDYDVHVHNTANRVDTIEAPLLVHGGGEGNTRLMVRESGAALDRSVELITGTIAGLDLPGQVVYDALDAFELQLGAGDDAVTVTNPAAALATIDGGIGDDAYTVVDHAGDVAFLEQEDHGSDELLVWAVDAGVMRTVSSDHVEHVTLDDTGDAGGTGVSSWTLSTAVGAGVVEGTTLNLTLSAAHADHTQVDLGAGVDTITTHGIPHATTVDAGDGDDAFAVGDQLAAIEADLRLIGAGGRNTLSLSDTGHSLGTDVELIRLADGHGLVSGQTNGSGYEIEYQDISADEAVTLTLGEGGDTAMIRQTSNPLTLNAGAGGDHVTVADAVFEAELSMGSGDDEVTVEDLHAEATVTMGSGDDTLTTLDRHAPLDVDGGGDATGAADALVVDRSWASSNLTGTLTASTLDLAVGVPLATDLTYANVEHVTLDLGAGSDGLTVASTGTGIDTTVNGGPGDETVIVQTIDGPTTVNGDAGEDLLIAELQDEPAELTEEPFDGLTGDSIAVARVDATISIQPTDWIVEPEVVRVRNESSTLVNVLNTSGWGTVGQVRVEEREGASGDDNLNWLDSLDAFQRETVHEDLVEAEGLLDVLGFAQALDGTNDPESALSLALSPNGEHAYAIDPLQGRVYAYGHDDDGDLVYRDSVDVEQGDIQEEAVWRPFSGMNEGDAPAKNFGASFDADGDTIIVGAGHARNNAWIYEHDGSGWISETLHAEFGYDPYDNPVLSGDVAIDGDTAVVGVPRHDGAFLFEREVDGSWAHSAVLSREQVIGEPDEIGDAVAIEGDTVIVFGEEPNVSAACTYFYTQPEGGWSKTVTPTMSTDRGGWSIAIDGDTAVLGGPSDGYSRYGGPAFVFERSGDSWSEVAQLKLSNDTSAADRRFGHAVAIDGDMIVVGDPGDLYDYSKDGAAYVFIRPDGGWITTTPDAKLSVPCDDFGYPLPLCQNITHFGKSVAVEGDTVVVGCPQCYDEPGGSSEGRAFLFRKPSGGWSGDQEPEAVLDDGDETSDFGSAMAADNGRCVIGAPLAGWAQEDGWVWGAAHVYQIAAKANPSSLAISPDGEDVYVTVPAEDSLVQYDRMTTTGALDFDGETSDATNLSGAHLVKIGPNGDRVYVAIDGAKLAIYNRDADGKLTFDQLLSTSPLGTITGTTVVSDSLYLAGQEGKIGVYDTGTLNELQRLTVPHAAAMTPGPGGEYLYVTRPADNALNVYTRDTGTGELAPLQGISMHRLGQARSVAVTPGSETHPGGFVIVACSATDSLLVFERDATSGLLSFVQVVRNRAGGVTRMENPNTVQISPDGAQLYASGALDGNVQGGLSRFDVDLDAVPPPPFVVGMSAVEDLTVNAGNMSDIVTLRDVDDPVAHVAIHTNDGDDSVSVQKLEADQPTDVTLGAGNDVFKLRDLGSGSATTVYGEEGDDWFRIDGYSLDSAVTVHGDAHEDGDAIVIDPSGYSTDPVTPSVPSDVIGLGGGGPSQDLSYDTMESARILNPPVVTIHDDPVAIDEGDDLNLRVSAAIPNDPGSYVSFAWDLDGDGLFADAPHKGATGGTDVDFTLPWAKLQALGMGDDGDYPITARATDNQPESGETCARLTIQNVAPTINSTTTSSGSVDEGSPVTVIVSATDPAGAADHLVYQFDWDDDGTYDASNSVGEASHTYPDDGTYQVRVRALDDDGGSDTETVYVKVDNVPPTAPIAGAADVEEGASYQLTLGPVSDPGDDLIENWTIDWGDGFTETVTGDPDRAIHVSHVYTDQASRAINATVTDEDGTFTAGSELAVTVGTARPTILVVTYDGTASPPVEGSPATIFALAEHPTDDPLLYEFDLNNDGTYEVGPQSAYTTTHTFDDDGVYTVTVRVTDEDDDQTVDSVPVVVENVAPTVVITGPATLEEAGTYTLVLTSSDPGDDTITDWIINWGDGEVVTVPTTSPTSQTVNHTYADDGDFTVSAAAVDEDGTFPAGNTVAVTVTNVAPTLTLEGLTDVDEGPYTLTLSASDPGDDAISGWSIDWGDGVVEDLVGSPDTTTHVFDGPGSYWINATASDEDGTYRAENRLEVTVANVAPTLLISGAASVDEGAWYTLNLESSDPGNDTIRYWTLDWGDGLTETVPGNPSQALHTYADGEADHVISILSVTDDDGVHTSPNTVVVHVDDVSPHLLVDDEGPAVEGSPYTLTLDAVDPGQDPIDQWDITWGDGTNDTLPGTAVTATHVYSDDGSFAVQASAVQEPTLATTTDVTAVVLNVPPTIDLLGDCPCCYNPEKPFELELGPVSDPGDDTVTEVRVFWGDGSTFTATGGVTQPYQTYDGPGTISHVYEDWDVAHQIHVGLVDEDGAHGPMELLTVVRQGEGVVTDTSAITRTVVQPLTLFELFTVGLGYKGDLDAGTIPNGLRQVFEDEDLALSASATVSTVEAGTRWQIADGSQSYTLLNAGDALVIHGDVQHMINWGDGTSDLYTSADYEVISDVLKLRARHIYTDSGAYDPRLFFVPLDATRLFTMPLGCESDLDAGHVSDALRDQSVAHGIAPLSTLQVEPLGAGTHWRLSAPVAFTVSLDYASALDAGVVSDTLKQAFADYGVPLSSAEVTVAVQAELDRGRIADPLRQARQWDIVRESSSVTVTTVIAGYRWAIDDGNDTYVLYKSGDALGVYRQEDAWFTILDEAERLSVYRSGTRAPLPVSSRSVAALNGAPTDISLDNTTVVENVPAGTIVGMLSTTDVDATDSHTYTLESTGGCAGLGPDNDAFTIDGNALKTVEAPDFEEQATYTVCVRSDDGTCDPYDKPFRIDVENEPCDLGVTKVVSDPTPAENWTIVYTTTVTNYGPDHAKDLVISDTEPLSVTFRAAAPTHGTYDLHSGVWDVGYLTRSLSATLLITAEVEPGRELDLITNTAVISSFDQVDSDPSNNRAERPIVVRGSEFELLKVVDDCTPHEGVGFTTTITLTNRGYTSTAIISDRLPSQLVYVSHAASQGFYDEQTGIWDAGTLYIDDVETLRITTYPITGTAHTTITSTATVTNSAVVSDSSRLDPVPENDAADVFVNVQKSDAVESPAITPAAGGTLVYTDTQGYTITFRLPPGAVTSSLKLVYTPITDALEVLMEPLPEPLHPITPGMAIARHAFDLTAYACPDCTFLPGYTFTNPISITIEYGHEDVAGLRRTKLTLQAWNGTAWEDAACGAGYDRHPDENWLALEICHLTPFALAAPLAAVGGATQPVALPPTPGLVVMLLMALVAAGVAVMLVQRDHEWHE